MKTFLKTAAAGVIVLIVSVNQSHSAMVAGPGGSYYIDTNTSLKWSPFLDSTPTVHNALSYGGISNWRTASTSEMDTLFGTYGPELLYNIYDDINNPTYIPTSYTDLSPIARSLRDTYYIAAVAGAGDVYEWNATIKFIDQVQVFIGIDWTDYGPPVTSYAYYTDPVNDITGAGHWVVADAAMSPVPVPSTLLLMGSGLVGLIGIGRKRMKR